MDRDLDMGLVEGLDKAAVEHIAELADTPHLAVVTDFDGTLAPFAASIYEAEADPRALEALTALSTTADTTAAVLSGRHLEGLRRVCPVQEPVVFGGSHGAESSWQSTALSPQMQAHLDAKEAEIRKLMERFPGAEIEIKPFQRVLHLRKLELKDPDAAKAAYQAGLQLDPAGFPRTAGKSVIEFSATTASKGSWIELLRERVDATAVVFLGDDVTDESGFRVLVQPPDLGVKIGEGETAARLHLADTAAATQFLVALAHARATARAER
ncbi:MULTISPECIES: trehalose-phosphatase [Corynebacterium]|uniref:trehalose-phosphatase n=1 Tax=Corynebacterium TaxID=1716 RepID=UPI00257A3C10|nr:MULTISPECIES: trehalose-phosphatase [Corynebacterium]